MNEDISNVLPALLLTWSTSLPSALVEVTVTKSDMPSACGSTYVANEPVRSKAKRVADFNNTFLINRKNQPLN